LGEGHTVIQHGLRGLFILGRELASILRLYRIEDKRYLGGMGRARPFAAHGLCDIRKPVLVGRDALRSEYARYETCRLNHESIHSDLILHHPQVALSCRIVGRHRLLSISAEWGEQLFLIPRKSEANIQAIGPDHEWDMPTGAREVNGLRIGKDHAAVDKGP